MNCCGDCKYHRFDVENDEWVCINPVSDMDGLWTEYADCCEDYEERD